jgi:hypothetical protein
MYVRAIEDQGPFVINVLDLDQDTRNAIRECGSEICFVGEYQYTILADNDPDVIAELERDE